MTADTWFLLVVFLSSAYSIIMVNALPQQSNEMDDTVNSPSSWSPSAAIQSTLPSALPQNAGSANGGGLLHDFGKAKLESSELLSIIILFFTF
ncbi:hypothetical protein BC941DRAFT_464172 [Chlamydoabsidia padenii]|nr:hypothetical protein BC941DRAFT_464172 [Chlamydoabsidia padenii]